MNLTVVVHHAGKPDNQIQRLDERSYTMPLWEFFAPTGALSNEDKKALAIQITDAYETVHLPRFYVDVVFHDLPVGNIFIRGEANGRFIRLRIDQIARQMSEHLVVEGLPAGCYTREWLRENWMETIDNMLRPYTEDRGYEWEVHIDETPLDLWTVQGFIPPPAESDAERLWKKLDHPVAYERVRPAPPQLDTSEAK
ncbi:tautomerase family protein [Nocardia asiatica]|uniref:tautomerase family protein n=1 Tax=Nocardia asiatica TaxID=209252 RepID=UPI003EE32C9B